MGKIRIRDRKIRIQDKHPDPQHWTQVCGGKTHTQGSAQLALRIASLAARASASRPVMVIISSLEEPFGGSWIFTSKSTKKHRTNTN
jgi:hypothetical protein